jgi:sulfur carrier protein ThiS
MPRVIVPPAYRGPTLGDGEIDVAGSTVGECLDAVGRRYPGFADLIFDDGGSVHRFVSLFVNGDEIPRQGLDLAVADSDRVEILAAIAGG